MATTLAGELVAQCLPSQKSQVTQGSQVSRIERDSHGFRSFVTQHIVFLTLKKKLYYIIFVILLYFCGAAIAMKMAGNKHVSHESEQSG